MFQFYTMNLFFMVVFECLCNVLRIFCHVIGYIFGDIFSFSAVAFCRYSVLYSTFLPNMPI